jgi:hypothetical protein
MLIQLNFRISKLIDRINIFISCFATIVALIGSIILFFIDLQGPGPKGTANE